MCYNPEDTAMIEALIPSLKEGTPFLDQDEALSYIGARGAAGGVTKSERIKFARKVLQEDFLPHVSTNDGFETTKSYFVGYMVQRLLNAHLGKFSIIFWLAF